MTLFRGLAAGLLLALVCVVAAVLLRWRGESRVLAAPRTEPPSPRATRAPATRPLAEAPAAAAARPPAGRSPAKGLPEEATLAIPAIGSTGMRVLSPNVLEVWRIGGPRDDFLAGLPASSRFHVKVDGAPCPVEAVGIRQRVRYAPDRTPDLRVEYVVFLRLGRMVPAQGRVEIASARGKWSAVARPSRWSPAIHASQEGYAPDWPKLATVGVWLGTLGEMPVAARRFEVVDEAGRVMLRGELQRRPDTDFRLDVQPYRQVWAADFSSLKTPGRYRVVVEGLGASLPFLIDEAIAADLARAYALGIYHQRCGAALSLPFTRFTHGPCHVAPAQVPTAASKHTNEVLRDLAKERDGRQTARPLSAVEQSLFPFSRKGTVDVHGGHHDAGDYSKYLIDSALMVHALAFAAEQIPGAAAIDNLGLPESGDGKSDLLQLAKWEADFIARAQDADGGFYFLVYPRDEKYEWNKTPDQGDPQVVFPKNTSATAAAVAALAQTAGSPTFRAQFPKDAQRYLAAAKAGFAFLERAWKAHGRRGAYQRVTHYGAEFGDRDEIAWAEAEMFLATGDRRYEKLLAEDFDPADPGNLRWKWWRLYESYGCVMREVALRGGRAGLAPRLVESCRLQVVECGREQVQWAEGCAYGTSYPFVDKRYGNASWYAGADRAFDAVAAALIEPKPAFLEAVVTNLAFDNGLNPADVDFVTGLGWRRQREIVSQLAKNDRRVLPPSGIPTGSLRSVEPYLGTYGGLLRALSFPKDDDRRRPYPLYDRWSDTWHVQTELVTAMQARCLASAVFLMARSPLARQRWRAASASIALPARVAAGQSVTATLQCRGLDLSKAHRIVWERGGAEPIFGGPTLTFTPPPGASWLEAEVQWADGRRAFAALDFTAR